MNAKKIIADFQLVGNRIVSFQIETDLVDDKNQVDTSYDIDYNINELSLREDGHIGRVDFVVKIIGKAKNSALFTINLVMEGLFIGNSNILSEEQFRQMLELNGIATLSHLCRSYILSVSSQSGINPPIKLPMINIHTLRELKSDKDN